MIIRPIPLYNNSMYSIFLVSDTITAVAASLIRLLFKCCQEIRRSTENPGALAPRGQGLLHLHHTIKGKNRGQL